MNSYKYSIQRAEMLHNTHQWVNKNVKPVIVFHPLQGKPTFRRRVLRHDLKLLSDQNASTFKNLFSPGMPCWQRFLGFLVLLGCIGLCIYQLYDRGSLFLREPTTVDVIVSRNETMTFPSLTLCSGTKNFLDAIVYDMRLILRDKGYTYENVWNISFEEHGLDLDQLWRENAVNASAVTVTVKTRMSTSVYGNIQDFPGIMSTVNTAYCNCLTFTAENLLELKGKTVVIMKIDQLYILQRDDTTNYETKLYYGFHETAVSQKHEALGYDDLILPLNITTLMLTIQKFSYLNKNRYRCQDQLDVFVEQTGCIDEAIKKADIHCRYPFISSRYDLKPCDNLNEIMRAVRRTYEIYDGPDILRCHKRKQICRETKYSYPHPIQKNTDDPRYSYLEVVIPDNTFHIVQEGFTYSFSALLSDVGGSLGFFLGLSLLTLFDALQDLTRKLSKILK